MYFPSKNSISLNCRGKILGSNIPLIMGVLNITPDSYYAPSRTQDIDIAKKNVEVMLKEGAEIIDVGAMSSRPMSREISEQEEVNRLLPILSSLIKIFPDTIFSVDTYRKNIAKEALDVGAHIINDIAAGRNTELMMLCANENAPYIAMHSRSIPHDMHLHTQYDDLLREVLDFFVQIKKDATLIGLNDLIIDPGFGFAKTLEQNYYLLKNLDAISILDAPLLIGVSRKSMIYKALYCIPEEALQGTSAIHMAALMGGAQILRVHDVKPAKEVITLYGLLSK